jgi:hypothetical protein
MQTSLEETLRRFAPQVLGAIVRRFRDFGAAEMPSRESAAAERFTANSHPAATIRHRSCAGDATRHAGGGKLRARRTAARSVSFSCLRPVRALGSGLFLFGPRQVISGELEVRLQTDSLAGGLYGVVPSLHAGVGGREIVVGLRVAGTQR